MDVPDLYLRRRVADKRPPVYAQAGDYRKLTAPRRPKGDW